MEIKKCKDVVNVTWTYAEDWDCPKFAPISANAVTAYTRILSTTFNPNLWFKNYTLQHYEYSIPKYGLSSLVKKARTVDSTMTKNTIKGNFFDY